MAAMIDDAVSRRSEDRHAAAVDAVVRAYRMSPVMARLVDVSGGGAMLLCDGEPPRRGDEVLLAVARLELVSTVAWANGRAFGLAFHRRLGARELGLLRAAGNA